MNPLLADELKKKKSEEANKRSKVRDASPEIADFINSVKSKFGIAFLSVEVNGSEIYRHGREKEPADNWDGKLRPSRGASWSR